MVHHLPFKRWPHTSVSKLHPGRRGVCLAISLSPLTHGVPSNSRSTSLSCGFPWFVSFSSMRWSWWGSQGPQPLSYLAAEGLRAVKQSQSLDPCGLHCILALPIAGKEPYVQPPADTGLAFQSILRLNSHKLFTFIKRQNCFLQLVKCERCSCLWVM